MEQSRSELPPLSSDEQSPVAVLATIRAQLSGLLASEERVARVILDHPDQVIQLSVGELAERAGTSSSTVVRACQRLGFKGYQHLKLGLAHDLGALQFLVPKPSSDTSRPQDVLDEVLATAARGIESVRATLVNADFHKAVALLANAHHVLCIGHGTSVAPAQDAAYSLTLIGLKAQSPQDILAQQLTATMLTTNDVCLFISHTGETIPTLTVAQAAQQAGAATIAITSYRQSALTRLVDITLVAGAQKVGFQLEAMASRFAHLLVVDALYIAVAQATLPRSAEVLDAAARITAQQSSFS